MNKGLPNGHANCLVSNLLINDNNGTNLISSASTIPSSNINNTISTSTPTQTLATMRLLSGNNKDNFAQHFLLLKGTKPENGQRYDVNNIQLPTVQNGSSSNQTRIDHLIDCINDVNEERIHEIDDKLILLQTSNQSQESSSNEQLINNNDNQSNKDCVNQQVHQAIEQGDNQSRMNQENKSQSSPKSHKPLNINSQHLVLQQTTKKMMKRIKRLQIMFTQRHCERQMKSFVEQQQLLHGIPCQRVDRNPVVNSSYSQNYQQMTSNLDDRTQLLTREGVKGLSTSELVSLVRRLESSGGVFNDGNRQFCHNVSAHLKQSQIQLDNTQEASSTTDNSQTQTEFDIQTTSSREESTLVKLLQKTPETTSQETLNSQEVEPLSTAIGTLYSNVLHLDSGYDSDATQSSSGGESCDDYEDYDTDYSNYSNLHHDPKRFLSIQKRSSWKWALERGAIASRWTWLQAQVADYEFKIRQQNEMYRQLRATKGVISFGVPVDSSSNVQESNSNKTNLSKQAANTASNNNNESDSHCVRTLPLNHMRKRKLVHSMNALSGATRKAAKYSTVQCSCNGLPDVISPCVLCNGRYSYVQVIDTDCMPLFERVALLDSSCHPVLSLNNDICLGLHFSELLKRETIQKPITSRHQIKKRKTPPSPTIGTRFTFESKSKSPKRSQAVISSTKLKKKYDGSTKRKYTRRPLGSGDGVWRKRGRPRGRSSSGSSRTESPIPSPASSESSLVLCQPLNRRRRSEQQYDINNIVIPYSIAATTRVEKLQYKEIITPKWRIIESFENNLKEIGNGNKRIESHSCTEEDISDSAFELRHEKCEIEEKKRILSFLKGSTLHSNQNEPSEPQPPTPPIYISMGSTRQEELNEESQDSHQ